MEDVQPLKRATDVTGIQRVTNVRRSVSTRCNLIFPHHWISRHHPAKSAAGVSGEGLQHGVLDKLRSGKYPQQRA